MNLSSLIRTKIYLKRLRRGEQLEMTREEAWDLLKEYNKEEFHLEHAEIVGKTMRYFAEKLGYGDEVDFWEVVGILHDLDFEMYPEEHCIKEQEIMRQRGVDERIIHATASHGYGITVDIKPEHEMEKVLYAVDELTGLIGAVVIMRPSKSVQEFRNLSQLRRNTRARDLQQVVQERLLNVGQRCLVGHWKN